jgi:hypothetical protein
MKKKTTGSGSGAVKLAVIGTSLAGIAATAYFFFGPKGKKNQKHAKAWAIKMKGDVVEKLEMARDISEPVYHEIIDSVAAEYEKGMKASRGEIKALAQDLKKHWKTISKSAKAVKEDMIKGAKRVAKKAGR